MGAIQNRPLKSFEAGARNWQRINDVSGTSAEARNQASQLRYRDTRRGMDAGEALFPFKIYQRPWGLWSEDEDFSKLWRTYRVRAGRVMETDATGTDADSDPVCNADPDALYYPLVAPEILVPTATAKFWFWLELGFDEEGSTTVVRYGPDPTAESYTPSEDGDTTAAWGPTDNPWTAAPVPNSTHIPIGWVDTSTDGSIMKAWARQLLRADVVQVGGGGGGTCPTN